MTKAGFVSQQITYADAAFAARVPITAMVKGGLGVFKHDREFLPWSVTHLESGGRLGYWRTRDQALSSVIRILAIGPVANDVAEFICSPEGKKSAAMCALYNLDAEWSDLSAAQQAAVSRFAQSVINQIRKLV